MTDRFLNFCYSCILSCCLVVSLLGSNPAGADDDTLENLWTTDAKVVREQILATAQLPGSEAAKKLAEEPVLLWSNRVFLGTDNAYSAEGVRYSVVRLMVANFTSEELLLKREKISLQAGASSIPVGPQPQLLRDIPLEIGWHQDSIVRPQSQLRTPRNIKIPAGKAVAFWTTFIGIPEIPAIPSVTLNVEFENGSKWSLDLNTQQELRLGLSSQRLGPQNALTVFTIHGQLNRINSVSLANEITAVSERGGRRFLIEWASQAEPCDEVLFGWLLAANAEASQNNPLHLQLPNLPAVSQLLLSQLPTGNEDQPAWEDLDNVIFKESQAAAIYSLTNIFERVSPQVALKEIRSGHLWSRVAALKGAGNRLGSEAMSILLELSTSDQPVQQQAAIFALGAQNQPAAELRLKELALGRDVETAQVALNALLANSTLLHREVVVSLLAHGEMSIPRPAILEALANHYHPVWDDYFLQAVKETEPAARRMALKVLAQIGHPDLMTLCQRGLNDAEESVRQQAFQILSRGSNREAEQAARDYALRRLQEGYLDESILGFVEGARETQAAPYLLARLEKSDPMREQLIEVIGAIGTDLHLQSVLDHFDGFTPEEQLVTLSLLDGLSLPVRMEFLRKVAADANLEMRFAILDAVKSIGSDEALTVLDELIKDHGSEENLELVCSALGDIGTEGAVRRLRELQELAARSGNVKALRAAEQGIRIWRANLPGYSYFELGHLHGSTDEFDQAIKAFSMAILMNPDFADAYSSRGNIHLRKDQIELAENDFKQALKLDVNDGQAVTGAAIVHAIHGDLEAAGKLIDEKASRFPSDPIFTYNMACVYARCVESLEKKESTPEREQQLALYQSRAIEKLKQSISFGFNQFDWMQKDPDLASLRELAEFQKLHDSD